MKQIKLRRKNSGRIDWKYMFKDAEAGDYIILPISLIPSIHGAARNCGMAVTIKTLNAKEIRVTFIDSKFLLKKKMIREFEKMPLRNLKAVYDAAKKLNLLDYKTNETHNQ
jgi:hypothetical protein